MTQIKAGRTPLSKGNARGSSLVSSVQRVLPLPPSPPLPALRTWCNRPEEHQYYIKIMSLFAYYLQFALQLSIAPIKISSRGQQV